eukprot:16428801-Heterocapsa_arctica.AAC.1
MPKRNLQPPRPQPRIPRSFHGRSSLPIRGAPTTQKLLPTVQQDLKPLREHLAMVFNSDELQEVVH